MIFRPESLIILSWHVRRKPLDNQQESVLFRLNLLGTFEPYDQWNFQLQLFGGLDHTLGDEVASHDTCKKIKHELKRSLHDTYLQKY
jgi:hypothetical protein